MKKVLLTIGLLGLLAGCVSSFASMDHRKLLGAGANLYQAATLDENEAKQMSVAFRRQQDAQANVAPPQ